MAFLIKDISREIVLKIHESSMKIMADKGIKFMDNRALEVFKKSGLKVQGEVVYFDEKFVMNALSSLPKEFVIKARDEKNDVLIGNGETVFCPAYGAVFVSKNNKRSPATKDDLLSFIKLTDTSKQLGMLTPLVVTPFDVPVSNLQVYQQALCLKYSTKPMMTITNGYEKTKISMDMIKKVYSSKKDDYITLGLISPISPLLYDDTMIGAIFALCENNQPLIFTSAAIPGATSPVSLIGSVVVTTAELLAGIVLSQILNPGVPAIYGNTTASTDLYYCSPAIGTPTAAQIACITKSMAEFYGLPCRSGGGLNDAKQTDFEAGSESNLVLMATMASGVDYALHGCGILDSFNIIGYEKFILDEQIIESIKFLLKSPNISDDLLGYQTIMDVEHGGQYLTEDHTLKYMRDEIYCTNISLRGMYEIFEKSNQNLLDKVNVKIEERLSNYHIPTMDSSLSNYLDQFLSL